MRQQYVVTAVKVSTDEAEWQIGEWARIEHTARKWREAGYTVSIHRLGEQVAHLSPARYHEDWVEVPA